MSTKLTLNIDEKVVARAKKYAERNKVSVSKIVENYLDKVSADQINKTTQISPVIEWLASSDNKVVVNRNDIIEELIRKNRK
jgi:predicted transcriptional regulator